MKEVVLPGGVANAGAVTRVGRYVLRPQSAHSEGINGLLVWLRDDGFDGAPTPAGHTEDGREVFLYIEGDVPTPPYPSWVQSDTSIASVASLLRQFHREAVQGFDFSRFAWSSEMADPAGGTVMCHNDVCLENVVFRDDVATALLDFDFAAPGRPIFDLAALARMCVPVEDEVNATRNGWTSADRPARLRVVTDAYRLCSEEREELLRVLSESMEHGGEFVPTPRPDR